MLGLPFEPEDVSACSSETFVDLPRTTRLYIPEDRTIYIYLFPALLQV
jgi:hypothetical protein